MIRAILTGAAAIAALIGLSACGLVLVDQPDPGGIPAGQPQAMPGAPEPIGPVVEIGSGRSLGFGWRYTVYRTNDGVCSQLELGNGGGSGCGALPAAGQVFGMIGSGSSSGGPTTVEGMVAADVASVEVRLVGGGEVEVALMSLEPAGLDGKAFIAIAPAGTEVEAIAALDDDGELIETFEFAGGP
jgi:hypothetical protein